MDTKEISFRFFFSKKTISIDLPTKSIGSSYIFKASRLLSEEFKKEFSGDLINKKKLFLNQYGDQDKFSEIIKIECKNDDELDVSMLKSGIVEGFLFQLKN